MVGANRTVSVTVWPAAIVLLSGSAVVAVKAPPNGGLERSMVTVVPPAFVIENDFVALLPTATEPKSRPLLGEN